MHEPFFRLQRRALGILLGWGLISAIVGALLSLIPLKSVRHFGLQALSWGLIDALIAWFGRRSAMRKLAQPQGTVDVVGEARRFRLILLINALLDIGYILGGWLVKRSAQGRGQRAGMGWGIIVQGTFLLIFDSVLALIVHLDTPSAHKL